MHGSESMLVEIDLLGSRLGNSGSKITSANRDTRHMSGHARRLKSIEKETAICSTVDFRSAALFGRFNLHEISTMANEALDKSPYPAIRPFVKLLIFSKIIFGGTCFRRF